MAGLKRVIKGGMMRCTVGDHLVPLSRFKRRSDGRLHSWCIDCKRTYDRIMIAYLRRERRLVLGMKDRTA